MPSSLDNIYLIKIDDQGNKSEIPATEANFQVASAGTVNLGLDSSINTAPRFGLGGTSSVIGGGQGHQMSGIWNTIAGGLFNTISGIVGSQQTWNISDGNNINGGYFNYIYDSTFSSVLGGRNNCIITGRIVSIAGGCENRIGQVSPLTNGFPTGSQISCFSQIIGGCGNSLSNQTYSAILGGWRNSVSVTGVTSETRIIGPDSSAPFVSWNNLIGLGTANTMDLRSSHSTILNGRANLIMGDRNYWVSLINGNRNTISGSYSTILNGCRNHISGISALILNGDNNTLSGSFSSILGGSCIGIPLSHTGAFVIADPRNVFRQSSGPTTLTLDFISGTYIRNRTVLTSNSVPISTSSFGISGEISFDNNYFYRHNGTNWTRTAMSTW